MATDYKAIALALHMRFPRTFIALSRGFTSSHKGIDMCWNTNYGGPNAPIFAPADGEVVALCTSAVNTWSKGKSDAGCYVKIKHATGVYTRSCHLQSGSVKVKLGDKVKMGQQIANMGNTGYSNGNHDHFEVYVGGSGFDYRVDPLLYCFARDDDYVHRDTERDYKIQHYRPTAYVGKPVARNTGAEQICVTSSDLYARADHNTSSMKLGFCNKGYYNVIDKYKESDKRTWYNVGDFWCASDGCVHYDKAVQYFDVTLLKVNENDVAGIEAVAKQYGLSVTKKLSQ